MLIPVTALIHAYQLMPCALLTQGSAPVALLLLHSLLRVLASLFNELANATPS